MIGASVSRNALILGSFAIATAATLALINNATIDRIDCNRQAALEASLLEVMPAERFDNNLLADAILVEDAQLGRKVQHVYRARLANQPAGVVIEATAADGYGGAINLLVGVTVEGEITGVRMVPPHNETPGLGDKIDIRKSDWMLSFNGKSLGEPVTEKWAVKKDGGVFDSFTGATITPRAVVGQVKRALDWYDAHRDTVFAQVADVDDTEHCDD